MNGIGFPRKAGRIKKLCPAVEKGGCSGNNWAIIVNGCVKLGNPVKDCVNVISPPSVPLRGRRFL
jgi:hypothetical protein